MGNEKIESMELFVLDDEVARCEAALPALCDAARLKMLVLLSWHLRQRETVRAIALCAEAEALLARITLPEMERQCISARLLLIRGEVEWLFAKLDDAEAAAREALKIFTMLSNAVGCVDAHWLLAFVASDRGDESLCVTALKNAAQACSTCGDRLRTDAVQIAMSYLTVYLDRPIGGHYLAGRVDILMPPDAHQGLVALANGFQIRLNFRSGNFSDAITCGKVALGAALASGQIKLAINATMHIGVSFFKLNDVEDAHAWMQNAFKLALVTGWPMTIGGCLAGIVGLASRPGQLGLAQTMLNRAHAALTPLPETRVHSAILQHLGDLVLACDEYASWVDMFCQVDGETTVSNPVDTAPERRSGQASTLSQLDRQRDAQAIAVDGLTSSSGILDLSTSPKRRREDKYGNELTRFLASASHDLCQPLHALNLYLGALSNVNLPEPAVSLLTNVRNCAGIVDNMFLSLLDLSRLDAQVVRPHLERFPVASLLKRIGLEFSPQATSKGLDFRIAPCSAWARCDPHLVAQILRNFVANAVRYTVSGKILIGCRRRGALLRIAVYDTGIGIAPHQQEALFDELNQVDNKHRNIPPGFGLGLAIVQRLGRLLSTPVVLASTPGHGSMFAIDLPIALDHTVVATPNDFLPPVSIDILNTKLIVVVDNDEAIREATRVLIEQWGCVVVAADSGADALLKLSMSPRTPDALVCDYRLSPSESGLDVIGILQDEFNHGIPALVITSDTMLDSIQEVFPNSLPVLHKPVPANILRDALIELLRS